MAWGHSSLLCAPGTRGGLEPNMVLPGKGVSICCLLGSSQGWDELQRALALRGGWSKPARLLSL